MIISLKCLRANATCFAMSALIFSFVSCKDSVPTPNDTKYLQEFHLVNFEPNEKYLQEGVETVVMQSGLAKGYDEITLGDDEYYCMGDNRPVSNDSRNLGPFSEDRIKGIAFVVIYPFSAFGTL